MLIWNLHAKWQVTFYEADDDQVPRISPPHVAELIARELLSLDQVRRDAALEARFSPKLCELMLQI
jgi:hypothetical protein